MPTTVTQVISFAEFAICHLKNGKSDQSLEKMLSDWRTEQAETIIDIKRSMKDFKDGKGEQLDEAFHSIREKLRLLD